jgi:hypothetical protein
VIQGRSGGLVVRWQIMIFLRLVLQVREEWRHGKNARGVAAWQERERGGGMA